MAVTQSNLAKRLGVSQALVSRVLSGKGRAIGAAPGTIRRILRTARAAGYRPSPAALALRGRPVCAFGVSVRDFRDPFFGHLLGELQDRARPSGHTLLLTGGQAGDMEELRRHSPDGLIILGSDFHPEGLDGLLADRLPAVRIGHGAPQAGLVEVSTDEEAGLDAMLDHLLGLGHRRMEFVGYDSPACLRRAEALRSILAARRPDLEVRFRRFPLGPAEAGRAGALALAGIRPARRATALLAGDDTVAYGALRALAGIGLRVPSEVSVAGVDDLPYSSQAAPSLTTIRQPVRLMARAAFDVLTGRRAVPSGRIRFRPRWVGRESSGPPPALPPSATTNPKEAEP